MVYVIRSVGVYRRQAKWGVRGVIFTASALVSSLAAGATLGLAGSLLAGQTRSTLVFVLAPLGLLLAAVDMLASGLPVLQVDRETRRSPASTGTARAAWGNGIALGLGATSRIGFWLWYVVPVAAFLSGDPLVGALLFGAYGLTRGVAPWLLLGAMYLPAQRSTRFDEVARSLLQRSSQARRVTSRLLAVVAVASMIGMT